MALKKKILLLITNSGNGGAQKVFYNLSRELSKKHEVVECVFDRTETELVYQSNNILIDLGVKPKKGIFGKISNLIFRAKALKQVIKKHQIDICISHMDGANWVNVLAFHQAKKVVCVHGSLTNDPNKSGLRGIIMNNMLSAFLYRMSDKVVTVSEGIKLELIKLGIPSKRIEAIPNFFYDKQILEESKINIEGSIHNLFHQYSVILFSGRLSKQKNIEPIFRILKKILVKNPDVKLVLIGDGELKEELIKESINQNLRTYDICSFDSYNESYNVYFLGHQKNPYQYLSRAKLSILTSYFEGFPLVIGESLSCGLPCISVDCPTGPRQILSDDKILPKELNAPEFSAYGVLMPMLDDLETQAQRIDTWARTIELLLTDPVLLSRYREMGIERMKSFSVEKIMPKWEEIIAHGK